VIGELLDGKYLVQALLGKGGMGEVYLVEHRHLGRREALKILDPKLASEAHFVSRFRREARAINRLNHPHIVSIHDFGRLSDGRFYLAMEYVSGDNLAVLIRREGRLSAARTLALLGQLAEAVQHAHSRGVVHRDLKPENLVVEPHEVLKVLDFGIAKIVASDYHESLRLTPTGAVMGTTQFMAPEQFRGVTVDARCDIYSIGCIGFEMITGTPPFVGRDVDVIQAHLTQTPDRPSARRPGSAFPPELDALLLRCLQKDPAQRYQTGDELLAALRGIVVPEPSAPRIDLPLEELETIERHYGPNTDSEAARQATELPSRERVERALQLAVAELAELIAARGDLPQVSAGAAEARRLDAELATHQAEADALLQRRSELALSARERENALRFAIADLRLSPADAKRTTAERQISAFEKRLGQVVSDAQHEQEQLLEKSIALASAHAGLREQRDSIHAWLLRSVLDVLPESAQHQSLLHKIDVLRSLLS
jgi:serine/threonine protein kinase